MIVGLRGDGLVEICSGLAADELVVSPETLKVRDGSRVRPHLTASLR